MKNKQFVPYLDRLQGADHAAPEQKISPSPEVLRWSDPNRVIERKLDGGDEIVAKLGSIPLSEVARSPEQESRETIEQAAWDKFAQREDK